MAKDNSELIDVNSDVKDRVMEVSHIQSLIYVIRGKQVMLDSDLAILYQVETKTFNQAVKRNIERFPENFRFQLKKEEYDSLRSQFVTSNRGGVRYLPNAFTEQGVAMLSGMLHSDKAINMNIAIMRAFVEIRKLTLQQIDFAQQIQLIKDKLTGHDIQLNEIYDAMENLLDEKAAQTKWDNRDRTGFKK